MSADHATVAEEEYLQTLFWLLEAGLAMTGANVARAMQLSAPTVHEMIGRLERDGYITRGGDKAISFTPSGRDHAEGIVRRHRLIERFLTDVLGIPWDEVDQEVTVTTAEGRACTVTFSVAETVSVVADPSPPPRIALPEQLVLARERYG